MLHVHEVFRPCTADIHLEFLNVKVQVDYSRLDFLALDLPVFSSVTVLDSDRLPKSSRTNRNRERKNFQTRNQPNATKANTRVSDENSEKTASTSSFIIGKEIF